MFGPGDARQIVTVSNYGPAPDALGVRNSFEGSLGYGALSEFAKLAAEGRFTVLVVRTTSRLIRSPQLYASCRSVLRGMSDTLAYIQV